MLNVKGKYNSAVVYTDVLEDKARQQIENICNMEIFKDSKIRIMPDVHAGAGCTIGTTMTLNGAAIVNMVGVDIGCGMETAELADKEVDFQKLDLFIKKNIPCGRNVREVCHPYADDIDLNELRCINEIDNLSKEKRALGSLGGGNHFIELDKDEEGKLYLVIHSGSRHLGKKVAEIYQKKSCREMKRYSKLDAIKIVEDLRKEGRTAEIESKLKELKEKNMADIPDELCYCTGELFIDYIHDMKIMQKYADLNRKAMMRLIVEGMGLKVIDQFTTVHNYIDTEHMILRKGAVSAMEGEKLLIPINMKDGSLICIGKGNPDFNCSAPHGAGRLMSRNEAFRTLDVEEFKRQMEGIYTTTATIKTLDESPMAYKKMDDIVANIKPTAEVIKVIRPIYNFKAEE